MQRKSIILVLIGLLMNSGSLSALEVTRVILFTIDGLHWEAPARLNMPVLNELIKEGTYVQRSYMIIPHHPTIGDYSKYNSCSFPNPMLHEGTIFISPENRMIQEVVSPKYQSAFVVNTTAYRSVGRGFSTCIMDQTLTDDQVVEQAIALLEDQNIRFMRIHLQTPGSMGENVAMHSKGKPYSENIWANHSPYASAIEHADKLLGDFISYLKKSQKWADTVLIVTSDHGQSSIGWHPMLDEDSWSTPLVFAGTGIAHGRKLPYFEHTDLAPTIASLLGLEAPCTNGGAGKVVTEMLEATDVSGYHPPQYIKTINQQIKEYSILNAKMVLRAEKDNRFSNMLASLANQNLTPEPFYHQDRITDWYKAGSTKHLIEANRKILEEMKLLLDQK